ncbi:MAG: DUF6370 family protein [Gemmataceae bacterium]|nr:DUF6370 family protein [Gemmataceae bacterium]
MRCCTGVALVVSVALLLLHDANAGGDKKDKTTEVTLKGKITCAKCDLGETDNCATVIVTKRDKKDVTIFFDAKSDKKYHGDVCSSAKDGVVTGTLKKDGKKEVIAVKELKYN